MQCFNLHVTTLNYPPASEASREVENFDWRKKHTPTRILCQKFVCLSVCLSVCNKLWPQLSQDWLNRIGWKKIGTSMQNMFNYFLQICIQLLYSKQHDWVSKDITGLDKSCVVMNYPFILKLVFSHPSKSRPVVFWICQLNYFLQILQLTDHAAPPTPTPTPTHQTPNHSLPPPS